MTISRRDFLTASAAMALWPAAGSLAFGAPLPREVDIAVIGGGAAGIAAARRIAGAGRKVIVIEASSQIGGRCLTDQAMFDVPFDRGAAWLHNPDANPMIKLARGAGLDVASTPPSQKLRIGRRNARPGETEDLLATVVRANRAIDEAARKGDIAAAAALPKDLGDWASTVEFLLGPYSTGKELKELSAIEQQRAQGRTTRLACRSGLGTLIAKLGEGLPVALSTPVQRIEWSKRDVSIQTAAGRIAARAAILTVSSNVLASGAIKFEPELPKRYLDAAAKLSLGSCDRIALQLAGNRLGLAKDEIVIEQSRDIRTAFLAANLGGSSLCTIDVAGSFGRDLAAQGEAAMVAFAKEWLGKLFGSDAVADIKRASATNWNAQPYVLGAMSAAVPGGQFARRVLSEPVGNLWIAGEASHETLWGTVEGAWETGERAADAALKRIGALKSDEPPPARKPKKRRSQEATGSPDRWPGSR
jgi:monoamine oxidase